MAEAKPAEIRREEILDAAQELFESKGYEQTSTTDIMKKVGIAKGTLYYHFASKEEILDALLDEMTDQMEKAARPFGEESTLPVPDRMIGVIYVDGPTNAGNGALDSGIEATTRLFLLALAASVIS